jgi:hypothetical protein
LYWDALTIRDTGDVAIEGTCTQVVGRNSTFVRANKTAGTGSAMYWVSCPSISLDSVLIADDQNPATGYAATFDTGSGGRVRNLDFALPHGTPQVNTVAGMFVEGTPILVGATLASAATITPVFPAHHISGTSVISTITPPCKSCSIQLIADAAWTTNTSGNIATAITAAANTVYQAVFDGNKWYIK